MDSISGPSQREVLPPLSENDPALDLLYVRGPDIVSFLPPRLLSRLESQGLLIGTIGDAYDKRVIKNKFLKQTIQKRLASHGHFILGGHGLVPDNPRTWVQRGHKHAIELNKGMLGDVPTETIVHWVHTSGKHDQKMMRTAHLASCKAEALVSSITPGSDTWRAGYTIIYGAGSMTSSSSTAISIGAALSYIAACTHAKQEPHPLVAFAQAGLARADGLTIIGGNLQGPVSFKAPHHLADLDILALEELLEGHQSDVMAVRVAVALNPPENFHTDREDRISAFLFARVLNGDFHAVQEVLESMPWMIEVVDERHYSLLHLAADAGQTEAVRYLIEKEVSIDHAINAEKMTPLMMAAAAGHSDVVKLLLENRANPNLRCSAGTTAVDLALNNNQLDTVKLLREAGKKTSTST